MNAELRDCVVIGGQPWQQGANQTSIQMARAAWRSGRKVLYVSRPSHSSQLRTRAGGASSPEPSTGTLQSRFTSGGVNVVQIGGMLALFPVAYPEPLRKLQIRRLANLVRREILRLGLNRPFILMYWPFAPELPQMLGLPGLYDAVDEHHLYPVNARHKRLNKRILYLEVKTARTVNAIASVSRSGFDRLSRYNGHTVELPNAVDLPSPKDVGARSTGTQTRISYVGGLDQRIDWDLVKDLCQARPHWDFTFIGGGRPPRGHWEPNTSFLGVLPYQAALRNISESNATIVPFVDNEFTRGSDFLKLLDSLSVGRPVVAADLPSVRQLQSHYPGWIRIATTVTDWLKELDDVSRPAVRERLALLDLSSRSTEVRFERLVDLLSSALPGESSHGA